MKTPPETMVMEFLQPSGDPVLLGHLGAGFMTATGRAQEDAQRPFRVAVDRKTSKAGNAFYEYAQNGVPFRRACRQVFGSRA